MRNSIRHLLPKLACLMLLAASHAQADDISEATKQDAKLIQTFINPTTIAIAKLDVKRLSLPTAVQQSLTADNQGQSLLAWLVAMQQNLQPLSAAMADDHIYIVIDMPISSGQTPVRFIAKRAPQLDLKKLSEFLARLKFSPAEIQGDFIWTSPFQSIANSNKIAISDSTLPAIRPDLANAIHTVAGFPVQLLFLPPDYLRTTFRELLPELPTKFGGSPTATVLDGIRWAAIGVDPATLKSTATIQSNSPVAAQAFATEIPKMLSLAIAQIPENGQSQALKSLVSQIEPTVTGDRISVLFNADKLSVVAAALLNQIIAPLSTREKMDNFKQLLLAMHNYASAYEVFPPNKDARKEDGSSLLSWRVYILPFIGEAELYSQFNLKEPWDSEHNLKLLEKMPSIFSGHASLQAPPGSLKPGYTTYVAPVGTGTVFGGTKPTKFADVTDGTSNTVVLVDVKPEFAVPWTAPKDYNFKVDQAAAGLATSEGQFIAALGDGSVQTFSATLPNQTIINLFQMNDGNAIQF